jgi:hypothetical protein
MAIRKSELYSLPHADQTLDQTPGAHPRQGQLRMLRGGLLLGKPRTSEPGRWTHRAQENQGGSDDLSNLKALCFRRNAGKRDGCLPTQEGFTDFRSLQTSYAHRQDSCVFCALEVSGRVLLENELALCSADAFPVTPGHSLVIPRRHGSDGLALHQPEWNAVVELLKLRREELGAQDATISG